MENTVCYIDNMFNWEKNEFNWVDVCFVLEIELNAKKLKSWVKAFKVLSADEQNKLIGLYQIIENKTKLSNNITSSQIKNTVEYIINNSLISGVY